MEHGFNNAPKIVETLTITLHLMLISHIIYRINENIYAARKILITFIISKDMTFYFLF